VKVLHATVEAAGGPFPISQVSRVERAVGVVGVVVAVVVVVVVVVGQHGVSRVEHVDCDRMERGTCSSGEMAHFKPADWPRVQRMWLPPRARAGQISAVLDDNLVISVAVFVSHGR
jgi:hypothetical protein